MSGIADFEGSCGENSSATAGHPLQLNQEVRLNGNTDLSSCITGNDSACVHGITLTGSPGFYDHVLNVDAEGPHAVFGGSLYLAFTDETGDRYRLMIYSSKRSVHTVRFDSEKPGIKKIEWSNTSID
ncbi:hypothetical protein SAMN04489860_0613 [Paraoerskovia marina]|uniref:Uncharacterized protein n=1 Tax=Paraoerskovia marina TaxID=545619 RepID=A0A1H1NT07_9CELL|nr:hypothetical protein [Paraoerskovia marina]SDS02107.1 hypothetical protein SAMN04489860_0613 [Paraoerskovia marina]